MALVAVGEQVHHHEPPLGDREVEVGRLADDGGVDVADQLDRALHGGVLRLLSVAEDHQQPARIDAAAVLEVLRGIEHRGHRGLRVAAPAPVEPGSLHDRRKGVAGPAGARRHHVEMAHEREGRAGAPAAHLDPDRGVVTGDLEAPAAGGGLDELGDRRFLAAHGRNGDELAQQVQLTRQGPPPDTSPSPCGRRSWCRSPPR